MSLNYFYKKFESKTDSQLEKIIANDDGYTEQAVLAAIKLLEERKGTLSDAEMEVVQKIEEQKVETAKERTKLPLLGKRIVAGIIDALFLAVISHVVGFILYTTPLVDPPFGIAISFILFFGYCFLTNSKIFGGQSLGKKVTKIIVQDENNKLLSLKKSIVRYAILLVPFFIAFVMISVDFNFGGVFTLFNLFLISSVIYLVFADTILRRSFHDIISKTYIKVTGSNTTFIEHDRKKNKGIYIIIPIFLIIALVGMISSSLSTKYTFSYGDEDSIQLIEINTIKINNELTYTSGIDEMALKIYELDKVKAIDVNIIFNAASNTLLITVRTKSYKEDFELNKQIIEIVNNSFRFGAVEIIQQSGFSLVLANRNKQYSTYYKLD